jgi:hypothetical protein
VEDDDLADAGRLDVGEPVDDRAKVQVAHRAPGEPAELQVDQVVGVGYRHSRAGDGVQRAGGDGGGRKH